MTVKICHLWSDALNWNGSRGNLICLKKRLEWRGIEVEIQEIPVGCSVNFEEFDLVYIGAGKAYENHKLLRDIAGKSTALQSYVSQGGAVLAVCEGFEILGRSIMLPDESVCQGLGIINMNTVYEQERLTGNAIMDTAFGKVVFFENHAGRIYPDDSIPSLGRMIKGYGNNDKDGVCGIHWNAVFACHAHGPLLPKIPALADEILRTAFFRRYPEYILPPLDDALEKDAHNVMENKLQ